MSQIIKAFTGIFIVLFMMSSSLGILGAFLRTLHAQDLHAVIIHELENSSYSTEVVEAAFDTSLSYGYELEILFYQKDGTHASCNAIEMIPTDLEEVDMAQISLQYPIEIAFFNIAEQQRIVGYAR